MRDVAVSVEGLGKMYHIEAVQTAKYKTLRDHIMSAAAAPFRRVRSILSGKSGSSMDAEEEIWALKDVSFEVKAGELVGIIGRNGAGKSTLLKILSRITDPTEGRALIHGRVGSLLEVGTGFHQELSGRENVFLNGAILGMTRLEIKRKFDEIVQFSGVEKFIDTQVKHYSSGMYLRLAFSVAAHLEPEILIVDEVLAVGDAAFQKKCLDKMEDVGTQGRTVLFVSHNMSAVTRLCDRTILLEGGRIIADGPSASVVSTYLDSGLGTNAMREWEETDAAPGNRNVRLRAVRVRARDGGVREAVDIREPVGIEMEFDVLTPGLSLLPHFGLTNREGIMVFTALDQSAEWRGRPRPPGRYVSTGWIPGNFLAEGTSIVWVAMRTIEPDLLHFVERDVVAFQVIDAVGADTARGDWSRDMVGAVRPLLDWTTEFRPAELSAALAGDDGVGSRWVAP